MFSHLIESESHAEEFKRKGRFFLATLGSYALLFLLAGVASIYAYDAHLENQNLEFIAMVSPVEPVAPAPINQPTAGSVVRNQVAQRPVLFGRINDSTIVPDKVSANPSLVPEIPKNMPVIIGPQIVDIGTGGDGPPGNRTGGTTPGSGNGNPIIIVDKPPPIVEKPKSVAPPAVIRISKVINNRATYLPKPVYPQIAKTARISGAVDVQILIDETGKVISARATSGNPVLYDAAVRAAYQARFSVTTVNDVPAKVSGIITYNFILQ